MPIVFYVYISHLFDLSGKGMLMDAHRKLQHSYQNGPECAVHDGASMCYIAPTFPISKDFAHGIFFHAL